MKSLIRGATLALGILSAGSAAQAQEWPIRPVKVIVPYAAGGSTDTIVRTYAESLSKRLGQQFVIENRGGAGGTIGIEAVAKSPPDGYTLGQAPLATLAIAPQMRKVGYDPFKDFAFIGRLTDSIYFMGVHPSVPADNLQEFVAYMKKTPGAAVNFGSAGPATSSQFAGEILNFAAGIQMTHVPYRGAADALNDLLAGQIQVQFEGILLPQYKAGKIKVFGVTTPTRHPDAPEIPPIREIVPGYDFAAWSALIAPAGTPADVVAKLVSAVNEAARDPEIKRRLLLVGFTARGDSPAEMMADLHTTTAKYKKLIADLKLPME